MSELDERAEVGRPWVGLVPLPLRSSRVSGAARQRFRIDFQLAEHRDNRLNLVRRRGY